VSFVTCHGESGCRSIGTVMGENPLQLRTGWGGYLGYSGRSLDRRHNKKREPRAEMTSRMCLHDSQRLVVMDIASASIALFHNEYFKLATAWRPVKQVDAKLVCLIGAATVEGDAAVMHGHRAV
jgi:hypothetical protein